MSALAEGGPSLTAPAILIALLLAVGVAYLYRAATFGRAHFDRVDRDGGSPLLSRTVMEAVYWSIHPVARGLIWARITPDMISWVSLVLSACAGLALCFGHFGTAGILYAISGLCDALDGLVARETGKASPGGEILDAAVDRYSEFFFLGGLLFYYRDMPFSFGLAALALLGSYMVSYSTAKGEAMQVQLPRGSMKRPERTAYLAFGAILSPFTIYWFETPPVGMIPVGYAMIGALAIVGVLSNYWAIERFRVLRASLIRRARERGAALGSLESERVSAVGRGK